MSRRVEVSRAADTTGTALRPLTRSSAVTAPRTEEHLVFCSTASRGFQSPGKSPDAFHKFKTSLESGALSHTEPVSGLRAVSAVSAAPRFARGQCYLKSLAPGARSCSFAIPKYREEPGRKEIACRRRQANSEVLNVIRTAWWGANLPLRSPRQQ